MMIMMMRQSGMWYVVWQPGIYHIISAYIGIIAGSLASGLPDDTDLIDKTNHQDIAAECLSEFIPFSSLMLNDDEIPVQQAFQKLQSKQQSGEDIKESLRSGGTWPKCWEKHQAAREQLSQRLQVEVPLPSPTPTSISALTLTLTGRTVNCQVFLSLFKIFKMFRPLRQS